MEPGRGDASTLPKGGVTTDMRLPTSLSGRLATPPRRESSDADAERYHAGRLGHRRHGHVVPGQRVRASGRRIALSDEVADVRRVDCERSYAGVAPEKERSTDCRP